MKRHRRSALETFDGCPFRFNVLYNLCQSCGHGRQAHDEGGTYTTCGGGDGQRCLCEAFVPIEDRGDETQRGVGFHEAAFRYIDRLAKARQSSDAEEASLALREGIAMSQLPPHLAHQVGRLWRPFTEWFQLDLDAYLAAEERQANAYCLACDWHGGPDDVAWKGDGSPSSPKQECCPSCGGPVGGFTWIPDLVYARTDGIEIVDWKTYYKGLTAEQASQEFQLKFYLWQAANTWPGFPRYTFTFNFVRLRYAVSVTMTTEQIEAFSDEVKGIALLIHEAQRTQNFPAIPGSHCSLCRLKCPVADNRYRMPVRLGSSEERDALALAILAKEQELRGMKKLLKAHCEAEGGFVVAGQAFASFPETSKRYPAAAVLAWLEERGHDVEPIKLSGSALGTLTGKKTAPRGFLDFLATCAIEKQGWTFRHKKMGEDMPAGLVDLLGDDEAAELEGATE